jgi:hypothetical protein
LGPAARPGGGRAAHRAAGYAATSLLPPALTGGDPHRLPGLAPRCGGARRRPTPPRPVPHRISHHLKRMRR